VAALADPYLVLRVDAEAPPVGPVAGRGPGELLRVDPQEAGGEDAFGTIADLRAVPEWRRVLAPEYRCGDEGFYARLHYAGGAPHPTVLRWASEEHYVRACAFMGGPADVKEFGYAREFSLSSGSALSAQALNGAALNGAAPRGAAPRPPGVEPNPLFDALRASWRAKMARYTQHEPSARALLATGRALLTARTGWCPQTLEIGTMAVRALLRQHPGLLTPGGIPLGETPAPATHSVDRVPPSPRYGRE
jgi:hypothetical protein